MGVTMEYVNRNTWNGFVKYWGHRQGHFEDLHGVPWDKYNSKNVFSQCQVLRNVVLEGDIDDILYE